MNPLEYNTMILKQYQDEMKNIVKKRNKLKELIKKQVEIVESLQNKEVFINPSTSLISRDVDLCLDFIRVNKQVTSTQIIEYLNTQLEHQYVRWPKKLDSNKFMSYMGYYLNEYCIKKITLAGNGGRRTTQWELK